MPSVYEHTANLVVGRKHTGKSTYLNGVAEKVGIKRQVLIVDVNGSPAYSKHQNLSPAQFITWATNPGMYGRIKRFYIQDKDHMFSLIYEHFRGGVIIFEDCTKYIDPNPSKQIKEFLTDHRMHKLDMIFTFHSLSFVPPFFWKMTNRVTLFKTNDIMEGNEKSFAKKIPNFKAIASAHAKIMKAKSDYENITVETLI